MCTPKSKLLISSHGFSARVGRSWPSHLTPVSRQVRCCADGVAPVARVSAKSYQSSVHAVTQSEFANVHV